MKAPSIRPVRCAIYTRVSTEYGLDQEFNSLDAQYDARTKSRLLATGATRGGVPFGRGSLFYLLRNRFYVGEVKYKDEILPGEQPAIMDRALFDAVQQKAHGSVDHPIRDTERERPSIDDADALRQFQLVRVGSQLFFDGRPVTGYAPRAARLFARRRHSIAVGRHRHLNVVMQRDGNVPMSSMLSQVRFGAHQIPRDEPPSDPRGVIRIARKLYLKNSILRDGAMEQKTAALRSQRARPRATIRARVRLPL